MWEKNKHRAKYIMCACVRTCTFDSPTLNNFSPFLTQNQILQPSSSKYTRGSHLTSVHTWSKCLVVWVLTIVPFQCPRHRRICQRDDFQPPGRRDVGAELEVVGVGIVDEKTLAGSCSTVQLKEIGDKLYQQI